MTQEEKDREALELYVKSRLGVVGVTVTTPDMFSYYGERCRPSLPVWQSELSQIRDDDFLVLCGTMTSYFIVFTANHPALRFIQRCYLQILERNSNRMYCWSEAIRVQAALQMAGISNWDDLEPQIYTVDDIADMAERQGPLH